LNRGEASDGWLERCPKPTPTSQTDQLIPEAVQLGVQWLKDVGIGPLASGSWSAHSAGEDRGID
jgi:hypothetical protein